MTSDATLLRAARQAYGASQVLNTNPRDVMRALHGKILAELHSAKLAYEGGALDQMCRHTGAATRLMIGVRLALASTPQPPAEACHHYERLVRDTNRLLIARNTTESLQNIAMRTKELYDHYGRTD